MKETEADNRILEEKCNNQQKAQALFNTKITPDFYQIYNEFIQSLLKKYAAKKGNNNIVISPYSIISLLLMAADATAGKTREEVQALICDEQAFETIMAVMQKCAAEFSKNQSFHYANAACVKEKISPTIKSPYKTSLEEKFSGKVFSSKNMVEEVNAWIADNTWGMIPKTLDKAAEEMLFCLINAVAFDAEWEKQYDDRDIIKNTFTNADGSRSIVWMLRSSEHNYIETETHTGFVKDYKEGNFSLMALLPKEATQSFFAESLAEVNFVKLFVRQTEEKVNVLLPEFKYSFEENLKEYCQERGVKRIFTDRADFTPITDEWLMADALIHKACIEVDCKGTKAAATTAMIAPTGCLPTLMPKVKSVKLDRPFVYAIMHNKTKLPVFVGVVNKIPGVISNERRDWERYRNEAALWYEGTGEKFDAVNEDILEKNCVIEELRNRIQKLKSKIIVIGVGGGGNKAINCMIDCGIQGVGFIAVDCDAQALNESNTENRILIDYGNDGEKGSKEQEIIKAPANNSSKLFTKLLCGTDIVFVVTGLGGETGTFLAPVVAKCASETGALTIAMLTKPFSHEGNTCINMAECSLVDIKDYADAVNVIQLDRLLQTPAQENDKGIEAIYSTVNEMICKRIRGITDIVTVPGMINAEVADIKAIMQNAGTVYIGSGTAKGNKRGIVAVERALRHLLKEFPISTSHYLLLNIMGGAGLTLDIVKDSLDTLLEAVEPDAHIIFGAIIDNKLAIDEVQVTITVAR